MTFKRILAYILNLIISLITTHFVQTWLGLMSVMAGLDLQKFYLPTHIKAIISLVIAHVSFRLAQNQFYKNIDRQSKVLARENKLKLHQIALRDFAIISKSQAYVAVFTIAISLFSHLLNQL